MNMIQEEYEKIANTEILDTVTNEGSTKVQTVAYKRKKRNKTSIV